MTTQHARMFLLLSLLSLYAGDGRASAPPAEVVPDETVAASSIQDVERAADAMDSRATAVVALHATPAERINEIAMAVGLEHHALENLRLHQTGTVRYRVQDVAAVRQAIDTLTDVLRASIAQPDPDLRP